MPKLRDITPRLKTADPQRAMKFYTELLGFRPCVLWPNEKPMFCILARDGVQIGFSETSEAIALDSSSAPEHYIEVEDALDWHMALKDRVTIE